MTFEELLEQVRKLLQREGRVAYRVLKRRFALDDDGLEDLKADLIDAKRVAVDEEGKVLVWTGGTDKAGTGNRRNGETEKDNTIVAGSRLPVISLQPLAPSTQHPSGERRQLTVMFCDLVGSTALSEQLDPEELREVVRTYQQSSAAVIEGFDGHIAQYLGDGLLVYFGYPTAHEDDAQRAVRAGLAIVDELQKWVPSPLAGEGQGEGSVGATGRSPLQVRIGIHTGLVVVGEMGGGAKREHLALGDTPNIAARIQGLAEPDSVVVSAATQRLVAGLFACQDLGPQTLKGLSTPLSVYQVVRESEAHSRFDVAVRTGLTPLVGRDLEIGLLQERWARAKEGAGQAVLLSGEAGIGKSRLVHELKAQLERERVPRIEFRCSPYHQNSAFYPIIEHLQRLLQFAHEDTPQIRLTKLQHLLTRYRFPQPDTLVLLATLLSLPLPQDAPPLTLSPQQQKQKTQEALVSWIVEEAETTAVCCVCEDLHWVDPSTLDVLSRFLDQVPTVRMLTVLTFRSDFTPPWRLRSHITLLTLTRLGGPDVESMVERMAGGKSLPDEVIKQIVDKTDGVPLFVEELTKMILESGLLRVAEDHYELIGPLPPLAIPSTLQDSLMARLDRLSPVRELVQLGATLGREFSYDVLRALSPLDEVALQQGLQQVVEAELLYQRGVLPQATYLFKHALIQDAAYQSLLKSRRQQLHQQVAQILADTFPQTAEIHPELVAYHYTEAGLGEHALPYWQRAGERAIQRYAHQEAETHLKKSLELLKLLPETPQRTQQEFVLRTTLALTLQAIRGYGSPEVEQAYVGVRARVGEVQSRAQLVRMLFGLCQLHLARAEYETAREIGQQLLGIAEDEQDTGLLVEAHAVMGVTVFHQGEIQTVLTHLQQSADLYDREQHRSHAAVYGQDPWVASRSYSGLALWLLGYPQQAVQRTSEALRYAQEIEHPFSHAFALHDLTLIYQFQRNLAAVQQHAEALLTLAREQKFPTWEIAARTLHAWVLVEQGQSEAGATILRWGIDARLAVGMTLRMPYQQARLAEACGKNNHPEEGLVLMERALATVASTRERWWEADLYRLKGELTLQEADQKSKIPKLRSQILEPRSEAEACFLKAIDIARQQQAKSLELRATMSLARLWQQQGKRHEAHSLLSEIYHWFTEGFDTKDLQEAKALLEELA